MLAPKKIRHRKVHKGRMRGNATTGCGFSFGEFALQATTKGKLTARQIEAARIALTRETKRQGKVWIRVFPDKPVSKKPLETRMGSGKGGLDHWIAPVRAGRVIFELDGVPYSVAEKALQLAASKLPFATQIVSRENMVWEV